jgi:L-ribulose-5-phosphate 4-epimerase
MNKFNELKRKAYEANIQISKNDLVILTFGNVSVIDRDQGVLAIKPSGVPYDLLKPEDMVLVDLDNKIVEGKLNPSSDTKTHIVLYRNFLKIESIVHAHSEYAVAWAQAIRPIPILGTTHADHLTHEVPCTNMMSDEMIKGDYEEETGNLIVQTFKNLSYEEIEMVLVAGHGPFTWGKTEEKAVRNAVILEKLAKIALLTIRINPDTPALKKTLIDKHYKRKHGKNAYYGQTNREES